MSQREKRVQLENMIKKEGAPLHLGNPIALQKFRSGLLVWFDRNQRRLPWRTLRRVPYRVWISEIMLQQTRAAVVVDYYHRFLRQFPNVKSLAMAREQEVLAAWSGLGYYRRARMLHQTASKIVAERQGKFPRSSEELQTLPGIGRYTAAAIASIAFGEPVAVVDGNVERVLERLSPSIDAMHEPDYWTLAQHLLDPRRPGDFNQAVMELGATICLPRNPECGRCPLARWCRTRGHVAAVQTKQRKVGTLNYSFFVKGNGLSLVQRPRNARLMAGMWELPSHAGQAEASNANDGQALLNLRHSITITDYQVRVFAAKTPFVTKEVPFSKLEGIPLTGLTRKILQRLGILNIKRSADSRSHSRRTKINARI